MVTADLPVTMVLAVGGPYAGQMLEVHGPLNAYLQLPWSDVSVDDAPAAEYDGDPQPVADTVYEVHLYRLASWTFAGRRMPMYVHTALGPAEVNPALGRAVFKPEVLAVWESARAD